MAVEAFDVVDLIDAWPEIRDTILGCDILIVSTPIWLGHPSSIAQGVLERLDAELGEIAGDRPNRDPGDDPHRRKSRAGTFGTSPRRGVGGTRLTTGWTT